MAELATIARPYAEALFKACTSDLAGAAVCGGDGRVRLREPVEQFYVHNLWDSVDKSSYVDVRRF